MKNRKYGSLTGLVATAVLLSITATGMMLEPDHVVMLSMMMSAPLLFGLTGPLQSWQTGAAWRLYSTNPGGSDIFKRLI